MSNPNGDPYGNTLRAYREPGAERTYITTPACFLAPFQRSPDIHIKTPQNSV